VSFLSGLVSLSTGVLIAVLVFIASEFKKKTNEIIINNEITACLFNTEQNRCWNTWNWKWSRKETKLQKLQIEHLMNLLLLSSQG